MLLTQLSHQPVGSADSHLVLLHSLHGGEGFSLPGCVPPDNMVNSKCVLGVKLGNSGEVIGYQTG